MYWYELMQFIRQFELKAEEMARWPVRSVGFSMPMLARRLAQAV